MRWWYGPEFLLFEIGTTSEERRSIGGFGSRLDIGVGVGIGIDFGENSTVHLSITRTETFHLIFLFHVVVVSLIQVQRILVLSGVVVLGRTLLSEPIVGIPIIGIIGILVGFTIVITIATVDAGSMCMTKGKDAWETGCWLGAMVVTTTSVGLAFG